MPIDAKFHFARLRAGDGACMPVLRQELESVLLPRLSDAGIAVWGVWAGMFGVASNEVIVVTSSATSHDLRGGVAQAVSAWNSVEIADEHLIAPTLRPSGTSRLTREGLYVFRYFEMLRSDVDDFIRLSEQGWLSFEHADEFETEPEGLFIREDPEPERAAMLPITWHDGLASVAALAPVPGRRTSSLPGARRAHVADHRLRHASAALVALRRSVR